MTACQMSFSCQHSLSPLPSPPCLPSLSPIPYTQTNMTNKQHNTNQTCLPKNTSVRTTNSLCPYFQIFDRIFLRMHHQSVMKKVTFSIIHFVRTVCELIFSILQTHYTQMTLFCLHLRKLFSIEDRRTLSPQRKCIECAAFADPNTSFLEHLLSGQRLLPWFREFFLLFIGFVQPLITDSFKPTILEDG